MLRAGAGGGVRLEALPFYVLSANFARTVGAGLDARERRADVGEALRERGHFLAALLHFLLLVGGLTPLFKRIPPVRALPMPPPAPEVLAGTSTPGLNAATTSPSAATTTEALATTTAPAQVFQGNFIDQIVENRDARVLLDAEGNILMLWTFLDRSTIVVATNEATLREIISRLSQASVLSLPPNR